MPVKIQISIPVPVNSIYYLAQSGEAELLASMVMAFTVRGGVFVRYSPMTLITVIDKHNTGTGTISLSMVTVCCQSVANTGIHIVLLVYVSYKL